LLAFHESGERELFSAPGHVGALYVEVAIAQLRPGSASSSQTT
jgi:hypothetical protein